MRVYLPRRDHSTSLLIEYSVCAVKTKWRFALALHHPGLHRGAGAGGLALPLHRVRDNTRAHSRPLTCGQDLVSCPGRSLGTCYDCHSHSARTSHGTSTLAPFMHPTHETPPERLQPRPGSSTCSRSATSLSRPGQIASRCRPIAWFALSLLCSVLSHVTRSRSRFWNG